MIKIGMQRCREAPEAPLLNATAQRVCSGNKTLDPATPSRITRQCSSGRYGPLTPAIEERQFQIRMSLQRMNQFSYVLPNTRAWRTQNGSVKSYAHQHRPLPLLFLLLHAGERL